MYKFEIKIHGRIVKKRCKDLSLESERSQEYRPKYMEMRWEERKQKQSNSLTHTSAKREPDKLDPCRVPELLFALKDSSSSRKTGGTKSGITDLPEWWKFFFQGTGLECCFKDPALSDVASHALVELSPVHPLERTEVSAWKIIHKWKTIMLKYKAI